MEQNILEYEATRFIHFDLPVDTFNKLEIFRKENSYPSRSKCMRDLLDFSLKFMDKVKKTPDPVWKKQLDELNQQKQEGDIIKYLHKLGNREFNLMLEIINQESLKRNNELSEKMKVAQSRRGLKS